MKNLFIDANVVIDYLTTREPFSTDAALLFELSERGKIRMFTASVSFNVIYYLIRQKLGHKSAIGLLEELSMLLSISDVTQKVIKNALASGNSDFEDSIQYYTALSEPEIDAIITRDKKGFKNSEISVFTPTEILHIIASEK